MTIFFRTFSKILGFLTAITIFIVIIAVIVTFAESKYEKNTFNYYEGNESSKNKIAIIQLNGPILNKPKNIFNFNFSSEIAIIYPSLIKNYLNDLSKEKIKGLIVTIDSPGGSVSASNTIFKLINEFKEKNKIKVYFHTGEMLASGAYWISLSGNKIFANYGSIVGSIGVKGPDWIYFNNPTSISSGLFGSFVESKDGIELFSSNAGTSKDILNPFRKPSTKEKNQLQKMVSDIYNDFINLVSKNRKIEKKIIINEIGAMIYGSNEAKNNYLIDDIKNINEIIEIMVNDLSLKDYQVIKKDQRQKIGIKSLKEAVYNNLYKQNQNYNYYKDIIDNKICNNLKYELSAMTINEYFKSKC